jgi:hypothetical protein
VHRALLATVFLLGLAIARPAEAAGNVGLGVIFGDPTALTLKLRISSPSAVQFHLGWGFRSESGSRFVIIGDYLYHFTGIGLERAGALYPYLGIGGKVGIGAGKKNSDGVLVGVRVPLGLSFLIRGAPLEIFLEIALGVHLVPATSELVDGGLGIRFYF